MFALVVFTLTSCEKNEISTNRAEVRVQDNTISYTSCVSNDEYVNASSIQKKIINQVDGALAAMELMRRDSSLIELHAIISVSSNAENKFSNSIIVCKEENLEDENLSQKAPSSSRSCKVCGVKSAYNCIDKISKDMESKKEFDVHVKKDGDCVILSW